MGVTEGDGEEAEGRPDLSSPTGVTEGGRRRDLSSPVGVAEGIYLLWWV